MTINRVDGNITSISEFKRVHGIGEPPKERPLPLLKRRGKNYPVDSLGGELSAVVREIQRVVQAPLGICAQSVLAAVSYATQLMANVHIGSQVIPLSLYFITVAASGERKSATDKMASRAISNYERSLQEKYAPLLREYEDALSDPKMKRLASKPRDPVVLMHEPTTEGMIKVYESGQQSLALFSDEGGHFLSGYSMNQDHRMGTAAFFSSLWDGTPISRIRKGDACIKLYNRRLAFHLMIQPGVAYNFFGKKELVDQGFMSRCLLSYPESTMGNRKVITEDINDSLIYQQYETKISSLLSSIRTPLQPIRLSKEAQLLYELAAYHIEDGLKEGKELSSIPGFANKVLNQTCRISAILTIYGDCNAKEIGEEAFTNACNLMEYYIFENIRLIDDSSIELLKMNEEEKLTQAQGLLNWLNNAETKEKHFPDGLIELRIMRQYAPYKYRKKETLLSLMKILIDYGYILPEGGTDHLWSWVN